MAAQTVKKHRDLSASTSWKAGYTEAAPAKSNAGGGYPHKQAFNKPKK